MEQQVKRNQNHYISEAPKRNKHVFAAFMSLLATANLITSTIKGHFCEQMGKLPMCRLTHPSTLNKRSDRSIIFCMSGLYDSFIASETLICFLSWKFCYHSLKVINRMCWKFFRDFPKRNCKNIVSTDSIVGVSIVASQGSLFEAYRSHLEIMTTRISF